MLDKHSKDLSVNILSFFVMYVVCKLKLFIVEIEADTIWKLNCAGVCCPRNVLLKM